MTPRGDLLRALERMAVLLDLDGANSFKVNAYTKAVRALADDTIDIEELVAAGRLTEIEGIGKGLAEKITEFWTHDRIAELNELEAKYPPGLIEMTEIPGFGAKKARAVFDALGVKTMDELKAACEDGRAAELKGFGKKTADKILAGIEQLRRHSGRFRLDAASAAAQPILERLRAHPSVQRVEVAGSLRRWRETVKDMDFVCATESPAEVMALFTTMAGVTAITGQGPTKSSVLLEAGMAADLRCVTAAQFPFTLQHFTGSKEHNTKLRARAKDMGLKSNEYGLFREGAEESLPAGSEEDIYRHLGLAFIPPAMREDMGEIEAAADGRLPRIVEMGDLRGLLHMHTHYSDGQPDIEDYAQWASEHGFEWMGIADHSQTAAYAGGLKPDRVREQFAEIAAVNAAWNQKGVRLLRGIEADILTDGSLDYEEELLREFDFIVASVHSQFKLTEEEQTARIRKAIENPYTTVLGHMTGRLVLKRDGYQVNQKEIITACAREGVVIEINANPWRLDIDWRLIPFALEQGAYLSIGPDAHSVAGLDDTKYGIGIANKGWVTKERLVNCWSAEEFLAFARRRRNSKQ
ncbi:DNA polymerase/3'-5' exonuclease PolX [Candidatus Poribacteria bacterium]|nr:DNA polymerase/3'-5' exonuclease PolX [Candidatus Poribacteria bacterium]